MPTIECFVMHSSAMLTDHFCARVFTAVGLVKGVSLHQGNLKGESVVVAILPSRMEVSYCTSVFFHS